MTTIFAPDAPTEWDYRAPTLAEQVQDADHNWDGDRCPHGMALLPYGPDRICGGCERDQYNAECEELAAEDLARLDRGECVEFLIFGPHTWEGEPARDAAADEIPF